MQILVVEDERRMADLLQRTLGEEGHQVVLARDGCEGFDIARLLALRCHCAGCDAAGNGRHGGSTQIARLPQSDAGPDAYRARCRGRYCQGPRLRRGRLPHQAFFDRDPAGPRARSEPAGLDRPAGVA